MRGAIREHGVTGVLHLAAQKAVGESVEKPLLYWRENVAGMVTLLEACRATRVSSRYLFSSSAAVFGNPPVTFVTEETPTAPMSPYGETKLVGEWLLRDLARVGRRVRWAALRYFNVAGTGEPELADRSVANLVPLTFQALSAGQNPKLFGDDYDTRDGILHPRLHPRRRPRRGARRGGRAARRGAARRGLQRRPRRGRHRQGGLRDRARGDRHRLRGRRGGRAAPATRPPTTRTPRRSASSSAGPPASTCDDMVASAWDGWQKRG